MTKRALLFLCLCLLSSCYRVSDDIEPQVSHQRQERFIQSLRPAFTPLTYEERQQEWGKEYAIAIAFAHQFDLYRAVSTFKRAEVLIDAGKEERLLEVQYYVLLSYYLGNKYSLAIESFEISGLPHVDPTFPAFHDLLVILYESYLHLDNTEKALRILEIIENSYPETAEKLEISTALTSGNIPLIEQTVNNHPRYELLNNTLAFYQQNKKSVSAAQNLNALLPGAGYMYVGQMRSGVTAMILNAAFIYGAYEFFNRGYLAAGIITASFEMGWYFGGIYGAGQEARFYNERLYEESMSHVMNQEKLFPVFSLQYGF